MLCPSTPAAPWLRATFCHAAARVVGRTTLSIRLYHLPPLTPLPSADTMRSVQIDASVHHHLPRRRASAPCVAFSGTPEAACCLIPDSAPPTSCPPSLGAVLLPALFTAYRGSGTTKAVTPADLTRPAGLSAYSALPSRPVALPVASAPSVASRLRHERAGSPQTYAESGSSSPACAGAGSTDCRFTSGCSPPRLTATQLPSITEPATGSGA